MRDYAAIATQYARDVEEGRILAGKWVRLACGRHLRDLERTGAGWRYAWNPELVTLEGKRYRPADRVCFFIELLPHIKGDWAARGEQIVLQPWQVFVVASTFGWINVKTRKRRFNRGDLFVPRKNGKSAIAAGVGLYMLTADDEFGPEVYSGATTEKQAGEVFNPAKLMALSTPALLARYGVDVQKSNINVAATNGKFEPLVGKPGDGASPSCAIVDEYHEHATEELYDTMRTGMGARSQPLLLVITTAGDDVSGPCYAHQQELQHILEGVIEDDTRFGIIYGLDDGDDWTTEEALIKANPNYGVSIDGETLQVQQREAVREARKQPTFQTKHLNIWVQSASPWLNLQDWRALGDKELRLEDFSGHRCHIGLDLSSTTDISSRVLLFRETEAGKPHFYAFWRHYLPGARIDEPDNKHYQGWQRAGWLTRTEGSMIDHELIYRDLVDDAHQFPVAEICIDSWGSPGIAAKLETDGFTVVRIPQTVQHLSAPMKYIDGLVMSAQIHHNGDPIALWAISNVSVKADHNGNWFPRRPKDPKKKIDPAAALLDAMNRGQLAADDEGSIDGWLNNPVAAVGPVESARQPAGR